MYKTSQLTFGQIEPSSVIRISDGACIPFDPANTDYQAYLKYIEQGGLVLPADAGAGTEEVTPE
jgi:hypothetical protein